MDQEKLPKLPGYSLSKVSQIRDALQQDTRVQGLVGRRLNRTDVARFVRHLENVLPGDLDRQTLQDTLFWLHGVVVDADLVRRLIMTLSQGFYELKSKRVIDPARPITSDQWMIVRVTDIYLSYSRHRDRHETQVEMRVVVGPAVGLCFTQPWSPQKAGFFSKQFGFDRKDNFLLSTRQLGRLFVYALFRREGYDVERLRPATFQGTSSLWKLNRTLLDMRRRIGFQCPKGFTHYCHQCSIDASGCEVSPWDPGKRVTIRCARCQRSRVVTASVRRQICDRCYLNLDKKG